MIIASKTKLTEIYSRLDIEDHIACLTNSLFKGLSHHDKQRLSQHRDLINIKLPEDVKGLYLLIGQYEGMEIELKKIFECFVLLYIRMI